MGNPCCLHVPLWPWVGLKCSVTYKVYLPLLPFLIGCLSTFDSLNMSRPTAHSLALYLVGGLTCNTESGTQLGRLEVVKPHLGSCRALKYFDFPGRFLKRPRAESLKAQPNGGIGGELLSPATSPEGGSYFKNTENMPSMLGLPYEKLSSLRSSFLFAPF